MSGMRDDRRTPECRRTAGIVDRIVVDALTDEDRTHAQSCADCGPVLARATRFDADLRQAARGLVVEELPRGILDPGLARGLGGVDRERSARAFAPGLAGIAAALVIIVLAATSVIAPVGGPTPGASTPAESSFTSTPPLFRASQVITLDMLKLKYSCVAGHELATPGPDPDQPVREGVVCATVEQDTEKMAALITSQNAAGDVVEITIKGDLVGTDLKAATAVLAGAFAKMVIVSIADQAVARQAADYVLAELPTLQILPSGDHSTGFVGRIRLTLMREPTGSFELLMDLLPPR
jgi:hypothetical protein